MIQKIHDSSSMNELLLFADLCISLIKI